MRGWRMARRAPGHLSTMLCRSIPRTIAWPRRSGERAVGPQQQPFVASTRSVYRYDCASAGEASERCMGAGHQDQAPESLELRSVVSRARIRHRPPDQSPSNHAAPRRWRNAASGCADSLAPGPDRGPTGSHRLGTRSGEGDAPSRRIESDKSAAHGLWLSRQTQL